MFVLVINYAYLGSKCKEVRRKFDDYCYIYRISYEMHVNLFDK